MQPLHEQSDRALVERIVAGDQRAFAALIGRYEESLAGLIRYQVGDLAAAEDVLQETLVQAWSSLARLREPDKVHAWLLGVARNRCRDYFKATPGASSVCGFWNWRARSPIRKRP